MVRMKKIRRQISNRKEDKQNSLHKLGLKYKAHATDSRENEITQYKNLEGRLGRRARRERGENAIM